MTDESPDDMLAWLEQALRAIDDGDDEGPSRMERWAAEQHEAADVAHTPQIAGAMLALHAQRYADVDRLLDIIGSRNGAYGALLMALALARATAASMDTDVTEMLSAVALRASRGDVD